MDKAHHGYQLKIIFLAAIIFMLDTIGDIIADIFTWNAPLLRGFLILLLAVFFAVMMQKKYFDRILEKSSQSISHTDRFFAVVVIVLFFLKGLHAFLPVFSDILRVIFVIAAFLYMLGLFCTSPKFVSFMKNCNGVIAYGKEGWEKIKISKKLAQISAAILRRESETQKLYEELGKAYYQDHKTDAASVYEQVLAIRTAVEELDAIKAEQELGENMCRCAECGSMISKESNFCEHCGAKCGK